MLTQATCPEPDIGNGGTDIDISSLGASMFPITQGTVVLGVIQTATSTTAESIKTALQWRSL